MRQILLALALLASAWSAPLTGNKITADGTYTVTTTPGKRYVFSASGTFGSGSLAVNWTDSAGTSTAFASSPATAAETWTFTAPTSTVSLVLSGSTNPDITVGVSLAGTSVDIGADDIADPENIVTNTRVNTALASNAVASRAALSSGLAVDPTTISGFVAGYRYADATVNAGVVDSWNDCSGNGYHATAVSTKSTAATGYATGGARYVVAGSGIPTNWRSVTIVAVYNGGRRTTLAASSGCYVMTSGTTGGAIQESGVHHFYGPEEDCGYDSEQYGPNLVAFVHSSTDRKVWQNWAVSTAAVNTASSDPITHIWGWASGTFTTVKERQNLFIFNRALTEDEIQSIARFYQVEKNNRNIHLLSDSFGVGSSLTSEMQTYIRKTEYRAGRTLANCSGSGQTIATLNRSRWKTGIQAAVDAGRRPIVIIDVGKNDLANNGSEATLETNYAAFCNDAIATGAKVVAVTIPPRNAGFAGGQNAAGYETARNTFNAWLRTQTFYSALADIAADSTIGDATDADNTTYYSDKIHLTDSGNTAYTKAIIRAINTIGQ